MWDVNAYVMPILVVCDMTRGLFCGEAGLVTATCQYLWLLALRGFFVGGDAVVWFFEIKNMDPKNFLGLMA